MCEKCGVQNHILIIRGEWGGEECYQDMDGTIWSYPKGARIGADYVGEVHPTNKLVKVVLTIAHLDHNIENNEHSNLMALCQMCHNRHDVQHRKENRKRNKGELTLF